MLSLRLLALHAVAQAARARPAADFARAVRQPEAAQTAYLAGLLARNRDTEYGRRHGFAELRSPADFARRVPLVTWSDVEPWVDRLMRGERRLLTEEPPLFYGRSTGSGGRHKNVPITATYQAEFQRTVHAAFFRLFLRFPRAFTSRLLYFVGPRHLETAPDGNVVGSMSGYNFHALPPLVRRMYAWPEALFAVPDLDDRAYVALHQAVVGDVSLVTGVFPLPIIAMLRDLATRGEELARDLERGGLDGAGHLDAAARAPFLRDLGPRPDLAARVRRAARVPDEERARAAFPRLGLVYCWTTATAGLYVPELRRRLGPDIPVRDAIFAATEAWCNVCVGDEEPGGPCAVTSVFLEFIAEADYERGGRDAVPLEGAKDGGRYYLVISNAAGLYRYVLGDVVEICGLHHRTPRIRFVRKSGATCNLAGELLDESHVNAAAAAALGALGLEARWLALVGDPGGERPGYDLLVEADGELGGLAERFDAELGKAACSYGDLRGEAQLRPVRLRRVPSGRYDAWRRARIAAGAGEAQLKTAHLIDRRERLPLELREEP